jgi:hypothetical protein
MIRNDMLLCGSLAGCLSLERWRPPTVANDRLASASAKRGP